MGLLDSMIGGALGQLAQGMGGAGRAGGGGGQADLLQAVVAMLGNGSSVGGLGGLLEMFSKSGLGDVARSWVGSGQNMPVSAGQMQQVLGDEQMGQLAQQFGLSTGDLAGQLSHLLPQVVDKLTPEGHMPQGGLGDMGALLGQLFGQR